MPLFSLLRQIIVATSPEGARRTALSLDSVIVEINFMIGPLLAIVAITQVRSTFHIPHASQSPTSMKARG